MPEDPYSQFLSLDVAHPIWERFFLPAPLAIIGTREPGGQYDLAPKHMVTPLGWENYFGVICTPTHSTYLNIERENVFTVSFPRPDQVVMTSLTASPRCENGSKLVVESVPTFRARWIDGLFLRGSSLLLECELDRIIDGFGVASLIVGKVIGAHVDAGALRRLDRDDQDLLRESPLLVYLAPGRFAKVGRSHAFPFPAGFRR